MRGKESWKEWESKKSHFLPHETEIWVEEIRKSSAEEHRSAMRKLMRKTGTEEKWTQEISENGGEVELEEEKWKQGENEEEWKGKRNGREENERMVSGKGREMERGEN